MRLTQPFQPSETTADRIPSVFRALEAYKGDGSAPGLSADPMVLDAAPAPTFHCSSAFLSDARRVGVNEESLLAAIGSGSRKRQWDGCVLVRDCFIGVELRLDPTERFGIAIRRVS